MIAFPLQRDSEGRAARNRRFFSWLGFIEHLIAGADGHSGVGPAS